MSIDVRRYRKDDEQVWNAFVKKSKNATFLFDRDYMDYHQDRFTDHSLLLFQGEQLIALLPANEKESKLYSHGGLSYGGLVLTNDSKLQEVLKIFYHVLQYCSSKGLETLIYKCLPPYLSVIPSQEDAFALFLLEAKLYRRDTACVASLTTPLGYQQRRIRSIKKAVRAGAWMKKSDNPAYFWENVLSPTLWDRHQLKPVHSLDEITLLMNRFPDSIKLYEAGTESEISAGTLVYETQTTAHAQYIATTPKGREQGTLDYLFDCLLKDIYKEKQFFSFGISNEHGGINFGLQDWKEGFGARTVALDFYEVPVKNLHLLSAYA